MKKTASNISEKILNIYFIKKIIDKYTQIEKSINIPDKNTPFMFGIFITAVLAVFILSIHSRYDQLKVWQDNHDKYFVDNIPMMSTLDAYKFIRHARENRENTFDPSVLDTKIFYPDNSPFPDPLPLLSLMLDYISRFTGNDLYNTAINMIPYMSSLFIIPLCIYFYIVRFSFMGIMAGFITTFSPVFYSRSTIGRFDTDGLNLFFLFTASIFLYLAGKNSNNYKKIFIYSGLLGITVFLFYRFYHHGMFNIIYLVMLAVFLFISKVSWKHILTALVLYILLSSPLYLYWAFDQFVHAINVYIFKEKTGIQALFPNVYKTISEAKSAPVLDILGKYVLRNIYVSVLGITGSILFVIFNFKKAFPLLPVVMLSMMSFISAVRFSMFLASVIGAGIGYIFYLLTVFIVNKVNNNSNAHYVRYTAISLFSGIFLSILLAGKTVAYGEVPAASIKPEIYKMFYEMKEKLPQGSAVYSWWDYGLAITDATGFPVFHSGMSQETPKTWMIALSLVSDEKTLYNIASYIDTFGRKEVEEMAKNNASLNDITNRIINYDKGPKNDHTYILLTEDMAGKYGAFGVLTDKQTFIWQSECYSSDKNAIQCGSFLLDMDNGILTSIKDKNAGVVFKKLVITSKGIKIAEEEYHSSGTINAVVEVSEKGMKLYMMSEETFNSSFVQLYLLNNINSEYFEEVIDNYPYGRLYLLKKQ